MELTKLMVAQRDHRDEDFKGINRDVRGFKERCDFLFYTESGITFYLLTRTILEKIIDFIDIID